MKLPSLRRRRRDRRSLEIEGCSFSGERDAAAEERRMERPPDDDVCPICFENFVSPCRGICGHWYCGGCILLYWSYGSTLQPCKCPMCSQKVTKLIPDASVNNGPEDGDILQRIENYNDLFVGGIMFRRVVQLSLVLVKRFFTVAMDPDHNFYFVHRVFSFAIIFLVSNVKV